MINGQLKVSNQPVGMRAIIGRVDVSGGTPSVGVGEGFTVVDTGAGQVQVVLDRPGKSIVSIDATALQTTDAKSHSVKVDAKTEASSVVFGVYVQGSGATTSIAASAITAPSVSNVTLSTAGGNTYSDSAVKTAIDAAVDALATKVKTNVDAGIDVTSALIATEINLQDGALVDNVGFYFTIIVKDSP